MKILRNNQFAINLQCLRAESGLSQYQLTEQMQLRGSTISRSTYSKIELGTANIKVTDLVILKEIYGVSYDRFFDNMDIESM